MDSIDTGLKYTPALPNTSGIGPLSEHAIGKPAAIPSIRVFGIFSQLEAKTKISALERYCGKLSWGKNGIKLENKWNKDNKNNKNKIKKIFETKFINNRKKELLELTEKFKELKSLVYDYKKNKEDEINSLSNEQKNFKDEIEKNKIEYEKIISDTADQIENFLEKTGETSKIQ
mgnify:CR=1 FL=1